MSALGGIKGLLAGRSVPAYSASTFGVDDAPQAPRFVRSARRQFIRFLSKTPPMRAGVGSALALTIIISGWLAGAVAGGHGSAFLSGAAATVGLKATDIVITGQVETSEREVLAVLGLQDGKSLVGFDVDMARLRLLELPWVRDAAIRKFYPGQLKIVLTEKKAAAVWQRGDRLTVVEKTGKPIAKFGIADLINNRFSHLPHLVGEGAAERAHEILSLVAQYPDIASHVQSYTRIANRRWDVGLVDGARIKLPEAETNRALARVARLNTSQNLLERDLTVVDVRLPDRVVLRLGDDAAKTRAELVADRLKAMKKAERKL